VPLINGADRGLRWFIQDVWGLFGADHTKQAKLHQMQHSA